jgi:hypothetical protein
MKSTITSKSTMMATALSTAGYSGVTVMAPTTVTPTTIVNVPSSTSGADRLGLGISLLATLSAALFSLF